MTTTSPQEVISRIERNAKKFAKPQPTLRFVRTIEIGQHIRQGDLYIHRVKSIPEEYTVETQERQLASGVTPGSRHCLAPEAKVRIFTKVTPGPLDGPAFDLLERGDITHPVHDHDSLPRGCYVVTYQQDWKSKARVAD